MATTTLGVNNTNQDAVAILNAENFQPLFAGANPMKVTVRETSKLTTWFVEDREQRTDHRYLEPVEIDIPFLLTEDTRELYEQLRASYLNGDLLVVQTRTGSYSDQMIYAMPHDETPEYWESIPVAVKMREIRIVTPEFGTLPPARVSNASQSDTVGKGQQQTTESSAATNNRASILYGVFS